MYAARRGNVTVLKELVKRGVDISVASSGDGFSALHLACGNELVDIAITLILGGADVDQKDAVSMQQI